MFLVEKGCIKVNNFKDNDLEILGAILKDSSSQSFR